MLSKNDIINKDIFTCYNPVGLYHNLKLLNTKISTYSID